MIEVDLLPAPRGMALLAFNPISALVDIVFSVTGEAGAAGALYAVVSLMASGASGRGMGTDQRETGCRMVKCCVAPTRWIVTLCAIRSPAAVVGIILGVAGNT